MTQSWFGKLFGKRGAAKPQASRARLHLERLEDRLTPVSTVTDLTGGLTAAQLVQSLVGAGVQISNVTYTGAAVAAGNFSGGQSSIGFDQGVILSTGRANDVIGTGSQFASTSNGTAGDSALDVISSPTFDAAILEFDFVPSGSILNFQYVFGSEEYPEFVNASVNDVFAFFLNGQNVALIPNSSTPISIDTVNANTNSQFYVDNGSSSFATKLDAFTTVLTITATVNANQSNHIKLAIADVGDSIYDSDVFIKAGSFAAPKEPELKVFNPVRFVFNKKTKTYNGLFTLINSGTAAQTGTAYIIFTKLPKGAWIQNMSGITSSGKPYIAFTTQVGIDQAIKLLVKIKNPLKKALNGFFITQGVQFSATSPV